ncbi:MAG TPA: PAS domain S-box protein, partial [Coriobacteriia bacterium]|nr:PAS domain S-box protein [Coriobacteriia bacterium]
MKAILARNRASQHIEHLHTTGVRKDGKMFPVSLTVSPIRDEDGAVVGASVICRDVTEQRKAFEAAQRLARIVESSDDAIIGFTPDGIVTSWNPAAEKLYGYSSQEAIGTSVLGRTPEDRIDEIKSIVANARASRYGEHHETERIRKDGTVVPVSFTISPILDEEGVPIGISTIARDATEQRRTLEIAQRIAAIVESSDDAIISGSLDGIIMSWNPAAERMLGYSSAEIVGRPASVLTPKDRAGEVAAVLEQIKAGQHVESFETKRVRKDGTVFPVSLTVSPIRGAGGAVVGTSVIYRDLTEQKGALALAQRMAAIVESSDDAIVARTLGYSAAEIIGKSARLLVPEDQAGQFESVRAKV